MRAPCAVEMMGGSVASASQVAPGRSAAKRAAMRSTSAGAMPRCTIRREPATQTCPALPVMAPAMMAASRSRSGASSNTSCGLLPPSSSVTGLGPCDAQLAMMAAPVRVEPVKVIFEISGWHVRASPVVRPSPCTTLNRPRGTPASMASSARRTAENGVSSEGLSTTALPAASAAPTFHDTITSGKFHGVIAPTTPYGSATTMPR